MMLGRYWRHGERTLSVCKVGLALLHPSWLLRLVRSELHGCSWLLPERTLSWLRSIEGERDAT